LGVDFLIRIFMYHPNVASAVSSSPLNVSNSRRLRNGQNVRAKLSILRKLGGISWLLLGDLTR
jgi:hypothetical protein